MHIDRTLLPICLALAGALSGCTTERTAADLSDPDDSAASDGSELDSGAIDDSDDGGDDSGDGSGDGSGDDGSGDTVDQDYWEDWPQSVFFPTYCGSCHPAKTSSDSDWNIYEDVLSEYDHIYCGVGIDDVPECGDRLEPGHLPRGSGPYPSDDERLRLVAWMDAGMPRLEDLQ